MEPPINTIDNALKVLDAVNKKIAEIGPHPTLEAARKEAEEVIDAETALTPDQARLLHEYVRNVLELTLAPKRLPLVGLIGNE